MARRERKYHVDTHIAQLLLQSYGYTTQELNGYTIRIRDPEKNVFYDWYHTQGTVVKNTDGVNRRVPQAYGDPEDLVTFITRN